MSSIYSESVDVIVCSAWLVTSITSTTTKCLLHCHQLNSCSYADSYVNVHSSDVEFVECFL